MTREQVQNHLAEITTGIPKEYLGKVEVLVWELFHFAEDAAGGRDEAIAANRALEELLGERQQQLTAYKTELDEWCQAYRALEALTAERWQRLSACKQRIKQLEAGLEKAKRETQVMRDNLDEWCQALNRAEEMAESLACLAAHARCSQGK